MILYKQGEDPYDLETFLQFKGNLVNYWDSTAGIGPELAKVAIHIHGVCVNSASVERLWSSMGFLHTNRRNRLKVYFILIFILFILFITLKNLTYIIIILIF
jgi:hypothetical protein